MNTPTLMEVTAAMLALEKKISTFNKKYSYDITKGTPQEQKEYEAAICRWDFLKVQRNKLKTL